MLTGILLLAIMVFIAVISYRRPRLEQRVFKNIPLIDWINILIVPTFMYFGLVLIVRSILFRPKVAILDFDESSLLAVGLLLLIYAFVGNSIHFVAKVLSRYIPADRHTIVYQVNEIFHGKLSHYLVFVCTFLVIFVTALLEINYPSSVKFHKNILWLLLIAGSISGVSTAKGIFYTSEWFGGYKKPLVILSGLLLSVLLTLFWINNLNFSYYPIGLFIVFLFASFIVTFIFRQFLIFSRLGRKRRLHFLAKLLSV